MLILVTDEIFPHAVSVVRPDLPEGQLGPEGHVLVSLATRADGERGRKQEHCDKVFLHGDWKSVWISIDFYKSVSYSSLHNNEKTLLEFWNHRRKHFYSAVSAFGILQIMDPWSSVTTLAGKIVFHFLRFESWAFVGQFSNYYFFTPINS